MTGFNFILWLAQGFGIGRIPLGPGTFGSMAGMAWFLILLSSRSLIFVAAVAVLSIPLAAWICAEAERILKQEDPGSVVLDEIIAIPFCFFGWLGMLYLRDGALPPWESFVTGKTALLTAGIFVLFRVFDIAKPWPVRQSQSIPHGWGVVVDDLLAAVYVNVVMLIGLAAAAF